MTLLPEIESENHTSQFLLLVLSVSTSNMRSNHSLYLAIYILIHEYGLLLNPQPTWRRTRYGLRSPQIQSQLRQLNAHGLIDKRALRLTEGGHQVVSALPTDRRKQAQKFRRVFDKIEVTVGWAKTEAKIIDNFKSKKVSLQNIIAL